MSDGNCCQLSGALGLDDAPGNRGLAAIVPLLAVMDSAYPPPPVARSPRRVRLRPWTLLTPALLLLTSLAAHGVLLKLPLPPQAETPAPAEPESTLSVVTLPKPAAPASTDVAPGDVAPAQALPPAEGHPPVSPTNVTDAAPSVLPETATSPQTVTVDPEGTLPETPPSAVTPPPPQVAPFPHLEGAIAGGCASSYGCYTVPGESNFRNVSSQLRTQLESQGYEVTSLRDLYDDPGREVYRLVDAEGNQRYLLVFSTDVQEAVYVVADEILTLDELRSV